MSGVTTAGYIAIASAAVSAVGGLAQANNASAAAKSAANVAESNRLIADQDRQQAIQNASTAQDDAARDHRRQLADMRASMGGSGLEVAGSPLDALADSSVEMALDQRRVGYQGYVANREGQIEMQNYASEASAARARARAARDEGYYSAGGALLTGGAKAYGSASKNK